MDTLLGLITPIGLIPLFILAGGIILFVLVALGGWGERTLSNDSKTFLAVLGTILTLIGLLGIILVVYPVLRPNVILIQQDLNLPTTLSTPIPQPTPTPLSPRDQTIKDATDIGLAIAGGAVGLAMLVFVLAMILSLARMMWSMSSDFDIFHPTPFLPRVPKLPRFKRKETPKLSRSITYRPDEDKK